MYRQKLHDTNRNYTYRHISEETCIDVTTDEILNYSDLKPNMVRCLILSIVTVWAWKGVSVYNSSLSVFLHIKISFFVICRTIQGRTHLGLS